MTFTSKYRYLKKAGLAIFADIIKIITRPIKKNLKTQEKLKELEIIKIQSISGFPDITKFADFR